MVIKKKEVMGMSFLIHNLKEKAFNFLPSMIFTKYDRFLNWCPLSDSGSFILSYEFLLYMDVKFYHFSCKLEMMHFLF